MIVFLLSSMGFAGEADVIAVPAGQTQPVSGPAVCMPESRFTLFLKEEQLLPICQKALEEAAIASVEADRRAVQAYDAVAGQFRGDAKLITDLQRQVTKTAEENDRLRSQRNIAWGLVIGLGVGGLTATVLAVAN